MSSKLLSFSASGSGRVLDIDYVKNQLKIVEDNYYKEQKKGIRSLDDDSSFEIETLIFESHSELSRLDGKLEKPETITDFSRLINSKELPHHSGPILNDKYYEEVYQALKCFAEKLEIVNGLLLEIYAVEEKLKDTLKVQEFRSQRRLLQRAFSFMCNDTFRTILLRLGRLPFWADEFEELVWKLEPAVYKLRAVTQAFRDANATSSHLTALISSVTKEITRQVHRTSGLASKIADQDLRLKQFEERYGKSGRSAEEIDRAGGDYTPDTLARILISSFNLPSVEIQQDRSFTSNRGAYGFVYKDQLLDGTQVAVKMFRDTGDGGGRKYLRLLREVSVLSSITRAGGSERTLELLGFVNNYLGSSVPCLVTPWCDGDNLRKYMDANDPLPRQNRLRLVLDVAEGLEYLHKLNPEIVHGDLKAQNVLVKDGRAVLCDFGLSRLMDGTEDYRTKGINSTKLYAAPEMDTTPKLVISHVNCMTDVYSFGSVFLEVMVNLPPFHWVDHEERKNQMGVTPFDKPPPTAPPRKASDKALSEVKQFCPIEEHWEFMKLCWSRNPWKRPSASEAVECLTKFYQDSR